MSMQISVDPASMSQEQREAVAGFILAYPFKGQCVDEGCPNSKVPHVCVAEIPAFIHKDTADAGLVEVGRRELEVLQHDHESTLPAAAFGQPVVDEAAAAFGVPPVPLGVSVPLAVSTPTIAPGSTVAPLPPANIAPITTTPGVASSGAGVDLDAKGLPWDNRIHAESKAKIADGTWRSKRNLDPALKASVEAELRQLMGVAPGVPLAPAATFPVQPAAPVTTPTAGPASSAVAVPAPPPAAPVVQPPPAPLGEVPADARGMFVALVGRASAAIQGQKVTQAEVNQCCADAGVPALPLLANRLDLVAQVAAHIDALIAARQ